MADSPPADHVIEAGGASIPKLGLGTWQNTGERCAQTVEIALELGYRHVDTAQAYHNEAHVGAGIAAASVDREEVFLTTKVWRGNLHHEDVLETVRGSLDRLGVGYVDLLLIHGPHPRVSVEEPLAAMARLRAEGQVKHLGVSNFTRSQLRTALEAADAPLVTNQVMYHPYKDQSKVRACCSDHGLALTAYSPLARGEVVGDETLADIGRRYDKTAAQVALRWLIQQDGVVAIPKSTSPEHLEDNRAVFDFSLAVEEMTRIDELTPSFRRRLRYLALPLGMRWNPF